MTREQAFELVKRFRDAGERNYYARWFPRAGQWCVWDSVSDHEVEFDLDLRPANPAPRHFFRSSMY